MTLMEADRLLVLIYNTQNIDVEQSLALAYMLYFYIYYTGCIFQKGTIRSEYE